jgi:hypothetical protein
MKQGISRELQLGNGNVHSQMSYRGRLSDIKGHDVVPLYNDNVIFDAALFASSPWLDERLR